jgi:AbrB family looped-hinge helix DNA binding protein
MSPFVPSSSAIREVSFLLYSFQKSLFCKVMLLKITSKRQVTFPRSVMEKLRLREGDRLSVSETEAGILIQPHRFDPSKLAPLRAKIPTDLPPPDLEQIRHAALDTHLRS